MSQVSTIFALSSAPGKAGVALIRVSGPAAGMVLNVMASPRSKPRVAAGRTLRHPRSGRELDRGIVIWFPSPKSFTGEDVAELQIHGGRAVVNATLAALAEIPGCRLAEPGEFARRAFDNGRIDLAEAEGLADLIDAETEAQRRQALAQAIGGLSDLYEGWRRELIEACALVEAAIDFSDEADIGSQTQAQARGIVESLRGAMRRHLDDAHRGEILRHGLQVVLAGRPNVGKSSLLNALARRDAAIVSEEAGTTRDIIEVHLDLGGYPVIVSDTAGLRAAEGKIEQEGIRRTIARAREADLVLWITDPQEPEIAIPVELQDKADRIFLVLNKVDLLGPAPRPSLPDDMIALSARTGEGLDGLIEKLTGVARAQLEPGPEPAITSLRHRQHVQAAVEAMDAFLGGDANQIELRADDLRRAASELGRITGRVDVEDLLDQIFSRFCLGK